MSNDYYTISGNPATGAGGASADVRSEFALISAGFDLLPDLTTVANRIPHVNSGSTAIITTSGFSFDGTTVTLPALTVTNNSTLTGDLAVNGGDMTSTATTFNLLNATVTTLNLGGAATTVALGAATGTVTIGPAIVGSITTDATSPTTGAWKTAGGLGVAKALWVGGLANIAGVLTLATGGLEYPSGATVGRWTTPTFSAGDYTASGSMTWTVASGDVTTMAYTIIDKQMTVVYNITNSTVGGTPNTILKIAIPASKVATKDINAAVGIILDNSVRTTGFARVAPSGTVIDIERTDGANWTASTDATSLRGQITFEIN